jgi:hypothetical protein
VPDVCYVFLKIKYAYKMKTRIKVTKKSSKPNQGSLAFDWSETSTEYTLTNENSEIQE